MKPKTYSYAMDEKTVQEFVRCGWEPVLEEDLTYSFRLRAADVSKEFRLYLDGDACAYIQISSSDYGWTACKMQPLLSGAIASRLIWLDLPNRRQRVLSWNTALEALQAYYRTYGR